MYKKVYIEITNNCNLNCDFCIKNQRNIKYLSMDEFKFILSKLEYYTEYLYFHVLGEPLIHPNINEFIDYASNKFKINLTTNGYLINNLKSNNVRQINLSLHSYDGKIPLNDYLSNILNKINEMPNTYFSLRIWTNNKYNKDIILYLNNYYDLKLDYNNLDKNIKLTDKVFLNKETEFIWPDLNNSFNNNGKCYGLIDHFGILVDGTIIPCCLDSKGDINLGNIFKDDLETVLKSKKVIEMKKGFKNNKRVDKLCQKCGFNIY